MGISLLEGPEAWLIGKKGRKRRAETRVVGQTRLDATRSNLPQLGSHMTKLPMRLSSPVVLE